MWFELGPSFLISVLDEYGTNSRSMASIDIPPAITDEEAFAQWYPIAGGGLSEKTGEGFAAIAGITVVVIADEEVVDGEGAAEFVVHAVYGFAGLRAAGYVGLVGYYDEAEAGGVERSKGFGRAGD
jgi:hypothetical protein